LTINGESSYRVTLSKIASFQLDVHRLIKKRYNDAK
jgi:hypothetical protein